MRTQVRTIDIYNGAIIDSKVGDTADIRGTKIRQATIAERGTVVFADDRGTDALTAVQGNDSRLHMQNTDTGTDTSLFTFNTDQSGTEITTALWKISNGELDLGGAVRYNVWEDEGIIYGQLEYCNDYNITRSYKRLFCLLPDAEEIVTADWTFSGDPIFSGSPTITGTLVLTNGAFVLPQWDNDASRPSSPVEGQGGYNLDTHQAELFDGTEWKLWG